MAVVLMLVLFGVAIGVDYVRTHKRPIVLISRRTSYTTLGFEWMGAVSQDGGEPYNNFLGEGI
jgi:hypothetical protein